MARRTRPAQGEYAGLAIHAGLICLTAPHGMDLDVQIELFSAALDELERDGDLVNQLLEVVLTENGEFIEISRYAMPADHSTFGSN